MKPFDSTIIQFCPIPIYLSKVELRSEEAQKLQSLEMVRLNENNGYSSQNKKVLHEASFNRLRNFVENHIKIYAHNYLKVSNTITFEIQNSWVVKHNYQDYSQIHFHENSIFSGVFYVKVNPDSGDIVFRKNVMWENIFPKSLGIPFDEHNNLNNSQWGFKPEFSDIVLFPSHLHHYVTPNLSEEERYCVAFNCFPRGKLGNTEFSSELEL